MKTRVTIVGLVLLLSACGLIPSGPKNGAGATVTGTVSGSQGGVIPSATVTVTPTGATALPAVQTTTSGSFTVDNVPTGDGNLTVTNLPANCDATVAVQYTGLKNGGTRDMNVIVGCATTLP